MVDPRAAWQDDDFRLIANGPVTLYWRPEVLTTTTQRLAGHGYHVVSWDASPWSTKQDLLLAVGAALDFPDHYGQNLDAFNDCLGDVVEQAYGWPPGTTGLGLVFWHYDRVVAQMPEMAQAVLDVIADQSRLALLYGRRMVCLVQSDDPAIQFQPVGATAVSWNDAEWLDAQRGLRG